jgi:hypothetical protein
MGYTNAYLKMTQGPTIRASPKGGSLIDSPFARVASRTRVGLVLL